MPHLGGFKELRPPRLVGGAFPMMVRHTGTGPGVFAISVWATNQGVSPMLRKLLGVFAIAGLMCVGVVMAEEIKGRIMKVDVDKKVLTVKDGDKEREIMVDDKADLGKGKGGAGKGGRAGVGDAVLGPSGLEIDARVRKRSGGDRSLQADVIGRDATRATGQIGRHPVGAQLPAQARAISMRER